MLGAEFLRNLLSVIAFIYIYHILEPLAQVNRHDQKRLGLIICLRLVLLIGGLAV